MSNKIKKTEKQIRTKASGLGLRKTNTTINKNFFKEINNEESAYWLGFIYADGYIIINKENRTSELGIQLSIKDKEHLEILNNCIKANVEIKTIHKKSGFIKGIPVKERDICSIRIYSINIVKDLIKNGVVQNKTNSIIYPIINNEILFYHFLRGFLDGDGCIWKNKNRFSVKFTNSNNIFLEYLQEKLSTYGFLSSIYKENDKKYNLYIRGDVVKFLNKIYDNSNLYLKRKHQLYIEAVQSRNTLDNKRAKSVKSTNKKDNTEVNNQITKG